MKISLEKLHQKSAERPPGYLEEVLAAGIVKDDFVHLTPAAYHTLRSKYRAVISPDKPGTHHKSHVTLAGLGDAVALIAKPIARAIDRAAGTNLANCHSCARRQAKLNTLVPFPKP